MKPRHKRFAVIAIGGVALAVVATLVLSAFQKNLVFFYTPSQVAAHEVPRGRDFRIGGLVKPGSLKYDGVTVHFVVTDTAKDVPVTYHGVLPDLFKQGKGVVTEGHLNAQGVFVATQVLAKHSANYMPPEAADAIKEAHAKALAKEAVAGKEGMVAQ